MSVIGLIGTALSGIIVGLVARWISPGRHAGGIIVTMLIGIAGAFLARILGQSLFGWYGDGSAPGWIMSILGAVLLLWLWRVLQRNRG